MVTDAGGCSITLTQAVNDDSGPTAGATTDANVICNGGLDGVVSVTATGGSLPYTISWTGGGTDASVSGLAAGNYSVTVTDITGCAATASTSISEPATVVASITATTNHH